jgi:hypothetical protein
MKKIKKVTIPLSIIAIILGMVFCFLYINSLDLQIETNLVYENGYKVVFSFSQPVIKSSFEDNLKIKPDTEGTIKWEENNKKAVYKPYYLKYNTNYNFSLKNVRSYILAQIDNHSFSFKIRPPSSRPLEKDSTPQKLPEQNKNIFTKPNGEKVVLSPPKIKEGKCIDVDISHQVLSLYQNGKIINAYEVSTGKHNMPTPLGRFRVLRKEENHWSYNYGLYMPYSLQFTLKGHYIHELPYWPSGYREGEDHLGSRVSHGCIRVGIGAAEKVYNFAEIGTPIIVHQ